MNEVWKTVSDLPQYKISNHGRLMNAKGRLLKGSLSKGYVRFDLCVNGKRIVKLCHRLVAEAFLNKVVGKPFINHKDGNKANNNVENLEWCTIKENAVHAFRFLGLQANNKRKVRCIETGIVYPSILDAEKQTGISNGCIVRCCKGQLKSVRNTHWEYVDAGVAQ